MSTQHSEERFMQFISGNLAKVLEAESKDTLGDRSKYIGASDIGGCPYKTVMSKKNPPKFSLKQQIIFQRGHLAEDLVSKMLSGLEVVDQHEVLGDFEEFELKAHLDKLIVSTDRNVIVEVKTVSAPIEEIYEAWLLQVTYQMGLLQQEVSQTVEGYILALDLNTGWIKTFKVEFSDDLFELCLAKASHIISAMRGECVPKAIVQNYCGTCPLKLSCPKQGKFAEEVPEDIKEDIAFIKRSKEMAKESKKRELRLKEYLVNTGIEFMKDESLDAVISVSQRKTSRLDMNIFKLEEPEMYKKYLKSSESFYLNVL